jgi:hypothetical protein
MAQNAANERIGKMEWWLITALFSVLTLIAGSGIVVVTNQLGRIEERLTLLEVRQTQIDGKITLLNYMAATNSQYLGSGARAGANDTYTLIVPPITRANIDRSADDYRTGR